MSLSTLPKTIIICSLTHVCLVSAQAIPTMRTPSAELQKTINAGYIAAQQVAALISSLNQSIKNTQLQGRAKRAEESIQDKKINTLMIVIPLMSASSYFLRGLERFGLTKQKIDALVKQMELTRLTRTMMRQGWAPKGWWGLKGGLALITQNIGMRLAMRTLFDEARGIKKNRDAEKDMSIQRIKPIQ